MLRNVILIASFLLFSQILMAQPKLEIVGGTTYDWGDVKSSDGPLKANIKIKNAGSETLKITQVKPGCGCTTAPLSKNVIEPNETASLEVTLDIGGRSGDVTKSIKISSNDPNNSNAMLYIKCNVFQAFSIFPTFLSFNRLFVGEESTAKLTIKNNTKEAVTVTDLKVFPNDLKLNIAKGTKLAPNQAYTVEATYTPKEPGRFSATVEITTSSKDPDGAKINFRGIGRIAEKTK